MTVVKMKKTISRPRKKTEKETKKDFMDFMDSATHMEHVAREFVQHIEDFGMDFLASEWAKFRDAQGKLSQVQTRCNQDKVGNKWEDGVTHQHFYVDDDDE